MSIISNDEIIKSLSVKYNTPLYVYDKDIILENIDKIKLSFKYKDIDIHFALMCNSNPHILKAICKKRIKAFVCSSGELFIALKSGFKAEDIIMCVFR